jgi:TonB family protein
MKYLELVLIVAAVLIFPSANARAGNVKVIANSSVTADTISTGELKRVFLEEKNSLADGTHVEPVLEKNGPVHKAFLQEYLGTTDDDLQNYYRVLVFTGRGSMPKELGSDAEVVAYVAKTKGAIGYVSTGASVEGVRTLTIVDAPGNAERKPITRIEPDYPEDLRKRSIGGLVRLKVTISTNGSVEHIELLGGNPILAASAIAAVKKWKYAPASPRTTLEVRIPFDPQR